MSEAPVKKETPSQRHRRLYREAGLVQVNLWVPPEAVTPMLKRAFELRKPYLEEKNRA